MKKFLLLMLVLGLASLASADVIPTPLIFTVNGLPQPNEITLFPSEVIELDLELPVGHNITAYEFDYVLSNAQARFITDGASGSYPDMPPMTDIEFPADFDAPGKVVIDEPQLVKITAGQILSGPLDGPQILMVELYIHCLDTTDVILDIINVATEIDGELVAQGIVHTLTIHQIPEPMTIALLGLGGLFALRKRK